MSTANTPPPTRRFGVPLEPLAIDESALSRDFEPRSFLWLLGNDAAAKPYRMEGDVAVVTIEGPLDTRGGWWWDGYDAIRERVDAALADPKARALVLAIDSPGGMAAGNLDAAGGLRSAIEAAGKPCVAHAGTMACSAAYALACAAESIFVTVDGTVGSIGIIATVYDRTKANEERGLDVRVVRSGALKADPHPDVPLTDASVSRVRARINELAGMFAGWVSSRRPQMGDPLALQGASVHGADAVARHVADQVGTLADAIAHAAQLAAANTKRKTTMDATARLAALRAAAEVETDDELAAAFATTRQTAARVGDLERQLTEARAALAAREKADAEKARADVLTKHRDRGALTPAMEADAEYMASLAPLTPEQLDANLKRLAGVTTAKTAAQPRPTNTVTPGAADPAAVELTAAEKAYAKRYGLSEAAMLATKRRDATAETIDLGDDD